MVENASFRRSAPRAAIASGDLSRDGRGRLRSAPPILHYGFRPFFFLAAIHAGLYIPAWSLSYLNGVEISGPFNGAHWHAHEMLFGFVGAVVAGFLLTAIPNWTGRLPLSGAPLAGLVALWLAGRAACLILPSPWFAMAIDLAFPITLSSVVWREVLAGHNWRNAPVAAMITLLGIANALDHLAAGNYLDPDIGQRLALSVAVLLIALIGGRIVPSFTRNWLVKEGLPGLPAPYGALDKIALAITGAAVLGWIVFPNGLGTGALFAVAAFLHAARLSRWGGLATIREPILFVLHVGYGWLVIGLALLGVANFLPETLPLTAARHALAAGAIGTMILAVMTRASLGHTGRTIVADRFVIAMYVMVSAGSLVRVSAPFTTEWSRSSIATAGALWAGAYLLFAVRYAPILWSKRSA